MKEINLRLAMVFGIPFAMEKDFVSQYVSLKGIQKDVLTSSSRKSSKNCTNL